MRALIVDPDTELSKPDARAELGESKDGQEASNTAEALTEKIVDLLRFCITIPVQTCLSTEPGEAGIFIQFPFSFQ